MSAATPLAEQTEETLLREVTYTNPKGETFSLPLWQWGYRQVAKRRYQIAGKTLFSQSSRHDRPPAIFRSDARRFHELPFSLRRDDGTVVRGAIDVPMDTMRACQQALRGALKPGLDMDANYMNIVGPLVVLGKMMFVAFLVFWIRFTYPRFREDQLQKFAWTILIPISLLNILVTMVLKVAF